MANSSKRFDTVLDRIDRTLTSRRRWLVLLFIASLALKLAYVVQSRNATYVLVPIMDSEYYMHMAEDILQHGLVRDEAFFMGPLYPYVLAVIFAVLGKSIMAARIVQVTAGAFTVLLTYLLGKRVMRPAEAMLGSILFALYGAATFYEGQLLMTWLGMLLNIMMLYVLLRGKGSVRACAVAGVLLGLSALARANVLVILAVLLPWILLHERREHRWRKIAVMIGSVLVTILPATAHNYVASHDFLPITSNGGFNFYIGNSDDATGIFYPPKGINFVTYEEVRGYVERLGEEVTPSEMSRYWFDMGLTFVKDNPVKALALFARKAALYFNGYEVPQIENYDTARDRYGTLRLPFVNMWMLLCLGLFGMLYSLKHWRKYFLLYGYVMALALSIVLFFVSARYRVQIAPVLALFAAHALLVVVPHAVANLRRQLLPAVVLLVLLLTTSPRLFALPHEEVQWLEHVHEARRLSTSGKYDEARVEIDKAVAIYPDHADSYIHRAIIEKEADKRFDAVQDYARALDLDPDLPLVQYDFGQILRQLRMYDPAAEAYRKAIELDPQMLEAYNNLGITYRLQRRYDDANREFEKVIELNPRYIKAYNNLGASLAESGNLDRAVDVLARGIEVDAGYANTYKNLAMVYVQKKDVARAHEFLEHYLTLEPKDERAQHVLDQLQSVIEGDTLQGNGG